MKRQIFVEGKHEYDYEEITTSQGVLHTLSRSHDEQWSEENRGELLYSVLDNGDGFKFDQKIKRELDYHEAFSLSVLLKKISFNECTVEITTIPEMKLL